jgi:hypothetical protein
VLAGGQAVNLWCTWASLNNAETAEALQQFAPFVSKDCDVLGDRELLVQLSKRANLPYRVYSFGQPTPVIVIYMSLRSQTRACWKCFKE